MNLIQHTNFKLKQKIWQNYDTFVESVFKFYESKKIVLVGFKILELAEVLLRMSNKTVCQEKFDLLFLFLQPFNQDEKISHCCEVLMFLSLRNIRARELN